MEKDRVKIPVPEWKLDPEYSYGIMGSSLCQLNPKYQKAGALLGDVIISTNITKDVNTSEKASQALAAPPGTEVLVHRVIDGELWRILIVL